MGQAGPGQPGHHSPCILRSSSPKPLRCCRTSRAASPPAPEHRTACKGDTHLPAWRRDRPAPRPAARLRPSPSRHHPHGNRHRRQRGRGKGSPGARGTGRRGRGDASHPPAVGQGLVLRGPVPQAARLRGRPAPPLHGRRHRDVAAARPRASDSPPAFPLIGRRLPCRRRDWLAELTRTSGLQGNSQAWREGAEPAASPPERRWPRRTKPRREAKPPTAGLGGTRDRGSGEGPEARRRRRPPSAFHLMALLADICSTAARSPMPPSDGKSLPPPIN